jgi:hypothetical protein
MCWIAQFGGLRLWCSMIGASSGNSGEWSVGRGKNTDRQCASANGGWMVCGLFYIPFYAYTTYLPMLTKGRTNYKCLFSFSPFPFHTKKLSNPNRPSYKIVPNMILSKNTDTRQAKMVRMSQPTTINNPCSKEFRREPVRFASKTARIDSRPLWGERGGITTGETEMNWWRMDGELVDGNGGGIWRENRRKLSIMPIHLHSVFTSYQLLIVFCVFSLLQKRIDDSRRPRESWLQRVFHPSPLFLPHFHNFSIIEFGQWEEEEQSKANW